MTKIFPDGAAIVFGGSGGIGKGVAIEFAKGGANVAVCYRAKQDVAEKTAETIRKLGVAASTHQIDVRDPARVKAAVEEAAAQHQRIHSMVWGAGPLVPQLYIAELTQEHYRNA